MTPSDSVKQLKRVMKEYGLNPSFLPDNALVWIAGRWHRQNVRRLDPIIEESHKLFDLPGQSPAPIRFWGTLPGLIEGKRRVESFASERGRLPSYKEFLEDLGLYKLYHAGMYRGTTIKND